ncbi:MAG: hypothetical protein HY751_01105 [Nitrospinae bacterium]|nr:hypothetical protein [Nitrospinota bacterium]
MIISVINQTSGAVSDEELLNVIRAINRQIAEDFAPYWSIGATLRLEGRSGRNQPKKQTPWDMRGDAVIYLWDDVGKVKNAIGYHDKNNRGVPCGYVFTNIAKMVGEDWSVTLSHEALELIGDPEVNLLVTGPHPFEPKRSVFFWYELCDAVQAEHYKIDGVPVSNFLLPLYFTGEHEPGGRNDFLGRLYKGRPLKSFGVKPGGYIGFFDPKKKENLIYAIPKDKKAQERREIKGQAQLARRAFRYQRFQLDGK